jgi:23S rRNA pseudouridine1911/1915/1917 synthase
MFRDAEWVVSAAQAGQALDRLLREWHQGASWSGVRGLVTSGKVFVDGSPERDPQRRVAASARVSLRMRSERRPAAKLELLLHVDKHLVVVAKPAGLNSVPYPALDGSDSPRAVQRTDAESDVLSVQVERALRQRGAGQSVPLGIVHRLDKETSGVLVFARTLAAKRHLKEQFRVHSIERRYLALVHGVPENATLSSRLVKDRGDGLRGSTDDPTLGRLATTHVSVLERLPGASLVECRLETGRTHQIRIQLSERGHPVLGERVYIKDYQGRPLPAPRLLLHAAELGFDHPATGERLRFEQPLPEDLQRVLDAARAGRGPGRPAPPAAAPTRSRRR